MAMYGRTIYDFQGDADQGELSFSAGQDVRIIRQDIGEGWWEGEIDGQTGLFPETYVEILDGDGGGGGGGGGGYDEDEWDEEDEGGWDEGGGSDDDYGGSGGYDEDYSGGSAAAAPSAAAGGGYSSKPRTTSSYGGASDNFGRAETLKRSVNRFSAFVKAGAEGFLIGAVKDVTIDPAQLLHVVDVDGNGTLAWEPAHDEYGNISINQAGRRAKFKGMKHYEAYNVLCEATGSDVERRYKHFDWLHERLRDKYSCICVPPMPDKQFMSKYGETFIEKREQKLQSWLSRIAHHPVLARDQYALKHFLTCPTSDTKGWKLGKRKAEKDDLVSATFFKLICQDVACPRDSDTMIDQFAAFVKEMGHQVKKNQDIAVSHAGRMSGSIKNEYKKIAQGFSGLGQCFAQNAGQVNGDSVKLSMAMVNASRTYDEIADLHDQQPKNDLVPFIDGLKEYAGMLAQFGDSINSSKEATSKVDELEQNPEAGDGEKSAVQSRCDVIHTLTLCEMSHFHDQRRHDFKLYMENFLQAQIEFHEAIAAKLRAAKDNFTQLY